MIFYGKPSNLIAGYFYDLLRDSKESIALFPRYNNIEIKATDYQNKYDVRVSNDGIFGIRYDLFDYEDHIDVVPRINPLLALVKIIVFLAFLLAGVLYITEYETFWEEGIYTLLIFTVLFLLMIYWWLRRKSYLKAVATYVAAEASDKAPATLDLVRSGVVSEEEGRSLDIWDEMNDKVVPYDISVDFLSYSRDDSNMAGELRNALVKEYEEYSNTGVDSFEERKNKIIFDVKKVGTNLYDYFTSIYDYSEDADRLDSLRETINEVFMSDEGLFGAFEGIYEPVPGYDSGIFELLLEFLDGENADRLYFIVYEKYTFAVLSGRV